MRETIKTIAHVADCPLGGFSLLQVNELAEVVADLVENDGVQLIEFDGGLGLACAGDVAKAVAGRAAVGTIMFGAESPALAAD